MYIKGVCVCVKGGGDGYTLQSSLILSSGLYLNIKFILVGKYFQIIKKMKMTFFQCGHPNLADPHPSSVRSCLLLADPFPPRCGHPLQIAPKRSI